MLDRKKFKEFIDQSVSPNAKIEDKIDLRVDPYANFKVEFIPIETRGDAFADSNRITKYEPLGKNNFFNQDLHRFVKSINDIEMNINSKTLDMPGIQYAVHRLMPMNSSPHFTMMWLNTKTPYIETLFMPWMQDNTIFGRFPIVKCDLQITFPLLKNDSSKTLVYKYYGVRPIELGLHKITNEPVQDFYRKIAFDFDYFYADTSKQTQIIGTTLTP